MLAALFCSLKSYTLTSSSALSLWTATAQDPVYFMIDIVSLRGFWWPFLTYRSNCNSSLLRAEVETAVREVGQVTWEATHLAELHIRRCFAVPDAEHVQGNVPSLPQRLQRPGAWLQFYLDACNIVSRYLHLACAKFKAPWSTAVTGRAYLAHFPDTLMNVRSPSWCRTYMHGTLLISEMPCTPNAQCTTVWLMTIGWVFCLPTPIENMSGKAPQSGCIQPFSCIIHHIRIVCGKIRCPLCPRSDTTTQGVKAADRMADLRDLTLITWCLCLGQRQHASPDTTGQTYTMRLPRCWPPTAWIWLWSCMPSDWKFGLS